MSLFRPINSSESNLFTIRLSVGKGSTAGVFNTIENSLNNTVIVSNNSSNSVSVNHLSSPTKNNLPKDFYIYYDASNNFQITYGKKFTEHPIVNITPHFTVGSFVTPTFVKGTLTATSNNLTLYFVDSNGSLVLPSSDGTSGFLGFDIELTGPTVIGITTGNSNKGWAISDTTNSEPSSIYSYLDVNLGSGFTIENSIVISKKLQLLNKEGTLTLFGATKSLSSPDYTSSVWGISDNIILNNLQPVSGLLLILYRTGTGTAPTINLASNCYFNNSSTLNLLTMDKTSSTLTTDSSSVILLGTSTTNFIIISSTNITLSSN
jgi:hypothetical protein